MENTVDPSVFITKRENGWIYYENTNGKTWRVSGTCIACGLCETPREPGVYIEQNFSSNNEAWERTLIWSAEPGQPQSCVEINYDKRLDIPVTPKLMEDIPECTLIGEWL